MQGRLHGGRRIPGHDEIIQQQHACGLVKFAGANSWGDVVPALVRL
jgi:hypothetical protein